VGDDPEGWSAAGFQVDGASLSIGDVRIELTGPDGPRGIHGWALTEVDPGSVDGLNTLAADDGEADPPSPLAHANRVERIDHVVVRTPDLERTVAALEGQGLEARRRREVPGSDPATVQVFFWAWPAIVELVGPAEPTGDGPAQLWGLALTCDDLDAAGAALGDRLGPAKRAVQPGRRIAAVRTRELDLSVPLALMSPHVP
jgi:catechol 2,3-dioxygenase-like lactoylglutathione lyase family enzyme